MWCKSKFQECGVQSIPRSFNLPRHLNLILLLETYVTPMYILQNWSNLLYPSTAGSKWENLLYTRSDGKHYVDEQNDPADMKRYICFQRFLFCFILFYKKHTDVGHGGTTNKPVRTCREVIKKHENEKPMCSTESLTAAPHRQAPVRRSHLGPPTPTPVPLASY